MGPAIVSGIVTGDAPLSYSRALFPTTFLEIAVLTYSHTVQIDCKQEKKFSLCTLVMKTYTHIFILDDLVWSLLLLLVF